LFLLLTLASFTSAQSPDCPSLGFFPNPASCEKFYRCVDMWGIGSLDRVDFDCPPGTSFDSKLLYCNWPMLVDCNVEVEVVEVVEEEEDVEDEDVVEEEMSWTSSPINVFECTAPGISGNQNDCHKFWLCKERPTGSMVLESLLYRCPDGYLFSSSTLRCAKEEDVTCEIEMNENNDSRTLDVDFIQLTQKQLPAFFQRWTTN